MPRNVRDLAGPGIIYNESTRRYETVDAGSGGGGTAEATIVLTSADTVSPILANGSYFVLALDRDIVIANPDVTGINTKTFQLEIRQSPSTGPWQPSFGSMYALQGDSYVATTTAGSVDVLTFVYSSATGKCREIHRALDG